MPRKNTSSILQRAVVGASPYAENDHQGLYKRNGYNLFAS